MKNIGLLLVMSFPVISFSQKVFEGKIVYVISSVKGDSLEMYFAPGKIRSKMNFSPLQNSANRSTYLLGDLETKNYYLVNDSARTVTKLILDSTITSEPIPGKRTPLEPGKTIHGFECYGISQIKADTINIMDTGIVIRSKMDTWYAKDLFFPYSMGYFFDFGSTFQEQNICLLIEVQLEGDDFSSDKVSIAAKTIEYTKLPESIFQVPTNYKMNAEKASDIFKIKPLSETKVKITDLKLEELDTIPPPPKPLKSPDKKPAKQKSGNN